MHTDLYIHNVRTQLRYGQWRWQMDPALSHMSIWTNMTTILLQSQLICVVGQHLHRQVGILWPTPIQPFTRHIIISLPTCQPFDLTLITTYVGHWTIQVKLIVFLIYVNCLTSDLLKPTQDKR